MKKQWDSRNAYLSPGQEPEHAPFYAALVCSCCSSKGKQIFFNLLFFASLFQALHFSGGEVISLEQEQLRNLWHLLGELKLGEANGVLDVNSEVFCTAQKGLPRKEEFVLFDPCPCMKS